MSYRPKIWKDAAISLRVLLALAIMGGAISCAVPRLIPIGDPSQRLEFKGFSILPPRGENWFFGPPELPDPNMGVVFMKIPPRFSFTHTINARVRADNVPPPVAFAGPEVHLQNLSESATESTKRIETVAFKTSRDDSLGAACLRYDVTQKVFGSPITPDYIFVMDKHGFSCLHPDVPGYVITIEYSQRRLPREEPLSLEAEGEAFLKSLRFTPVPSR